jgi:hypothetical protein
MASKQKYRKLVLGPSGKITARSSVVGLVVIADYLDPANNQRTLVLERPSAVVAVEPKPLTPRKKKTAAAGEETPAPNKSLEFPGA